MVENHVDENGDDVCDDCGSIHEHIFGGMQFDEVYHWVSATCTWNGCDIQTEIEHCDNDKNNICDDCGCDDLSAFYNVAQIVMDYEESKKVEVDELNEKIPEYKYCYNPVATVSCSFKLTSEDSLDAIIEKYDMNNAFVGAKISNLGIIKSILVTFDKAEFTEAMYRRLTKIGEEEPLIEKVSISMQMEWANSYMPRIEYYTDYEKILNHEVTSNIVKPQGGNFIIKTKEEYDNYLNSLLENAEYANLKESINEQKDLYDEAFFEENALIVTRTVSTGSSSNKLTVNNLYLSANKIYVVVKTDVANTGLANMKYEYFTIKVPKNAVVDVDEVITFG